MLELLKWRRTTKTTFSTLKTATASRGQNITRCGQWSSDDTFTVNLGPLRFMTFCSHFNSLGSSSTTFIDVTRLKVAYGDRLALRALVSPMVWTRFWKNFDLPIFFDFFPIFRFFFSISDFQFSDFRFPDFLSLQSVFLMPQITYTKFGSDRSKGAKVEKRDWHTDRQNNVYFNRIRKWELGRQFYKVSSSFFPSLSIPTGFSTSIDFTFM